MPVSAARMFIAAAADVGVARRIANDWLGERGWLFVVSDALDSDPERERLIAAAMLLTVRDDLVVIRLDGAEPPLGFRDLHAYDVPRDPPPADLAVRHSRNEFIEFGGVVDLYSTTASWSDDDISLDELRVEPPAPARLAMRSNRILLLLAIMAIAATVASLWFLAGSASPTTSARGPWQFIAGIGVTLVVMAAALTVRRGLRRRQGRSSNAPAAGLFSAAATGKGIFISYSHRDSRMAHDLADEIQRQGRRAWIFEQQMQGGAMGWAGQVVKALRESRAVMLVGSANAFGSDQVMREMYLAMDMKKPIVPLIVGDAPMPDDFQYILAKFQRHPVQRPLDTLVARALADC